MAQRMILTDEERLQAIRLRQAGSSYVLIGKLFGVSGNCISDICNYRNKKPIMLTQLTMQTLKSQFAPLITKLRKKARLSQREVAENLNIKLATYAAYEESRNEPDIETLNNLLKLYNLPSLEIILKT